MTERHCFFDRVPRVNLSRAPLQALPQWKALALARYPVAIEVADCSKVSAILLGAKIRTDEDRKRMLGPGLLVFEVGSVPPADMSPTGFYLAAAGASESVELVDGAALIAAGKTGVATMLFLCRWGGGVATMLFLCRWGGEGHEGDRGCSCAGRGSHEGGRFFPSRLIVRFGIQRTKLFVHRRPPVREAMSGPATETSNLLQL